MKLPTGVTLNINNKKYKGEVPDSILSEAQKKYYEKKYSVPEKKPEVKKTEDKK